MERINFFGVTSEQNNYRRIEIFPTEVSMILDPYNHMQEKLSEFVDLGENWDGYGGIPLLKEVSNVASQFITSLNSVYIDQITDIFPNPNGTVSIEWENKKQEKISLEIGQRNYSYFINYNNKEPKFVNGENIILDFKDFTETVSELFGEETYYSVFSTGTNS